MTEQEYMKKIIEHFNQCDINDFDGKYIVTPKSIQQLVQPTSMLGNPFKIYESIYPIVWAFSIGRKSDNYMHLAIRSVYITRGEEKQLYELCMEHGLDIHIWSKYLELGLPKHRFRYTGGMFVELNRPTIDDFTWKDDILLKSLLGKQSSRMTDIWSYLRQAKAQEEARRKAIEQTPKKNAAKLYNPGNARRR